jgi:site-specific recombinase XerD
VKTDDLGRHLRLFLGEYLPKQRNASPRTVRAYRDALKLLLCHIAKSRRRSVADLRFADLDRASVLAFLEAIELQRGNAVTTRNHRLAAIRAFFRFVSRHAPDVVEQCSQILAVPMKRGDSRSIDYLTLDEVHAILREVPCDTPAGRRDDALLRFLYNTGARVQEAVDLRIGGLQLDSPAHVLLLGKGRKERLCPLWPETVARLRRVLAEQPGSEPSSPVFPNRDGCPLTRFGARYILSKYVLAAIPQCASLGRKRVHPHTMRHTTAMHLLQSGVDLNTIRCWLGHASVATTNRYVEIDLEMKRRALEGVRSPPSSRKPTMPDAALLTWLESL